MHIARHAVTGSAGVISAFNTRCKIRRDCIHALWHSRGAKRHNGKLHRAIMIRSVRSAIMLRKLSTVCRVRDTRDASRCWQRASPTFSRLSRISPILPLCPSVEKKDGVISSSSRSRNDVICVVVAETKLKLERVFANFVILAIAPNKWEMGPFRLDRSISLSVCVSRGFLRKHVRALCIGIRGSFTCNLARNSL
jgi:hypothetical protein